MGESSEFKQGEWQGMITNELQAIKAGQQKMVEALDSFKERTGARIGDAEKSIERINGEMTIVLTIGRWIFAPVFSVMGIGLVVVIGWYLIRKGG